MRVVVTGATGYIGGRLVPLLLDAGHDVRVLVRDPSRIRGRPWSDRVEVARGDLLRDMGLREALAGADAAYYLVHSMSDAKDFEARDREAAKRFASAGNGLRKVVYLGGLLPSGEGVSSHLGSRAEVGRILRDSLPTLEFRAGPIIGSGSASFEMVRYLTERLPAMIAPRWILNPVQPIGIQDVLSYLRGALDLDAVGVVDIGADRQTFKRMMEVYAEVRGLRRMIVPVPVLAPWLAAQWVGLVTPIPNRLAVPLIEGVVRPVLADTTRARELFPRVDPVSYREAVKGALQEVERHEVRTRWSDAVDMAPTYELTDREGMIREERTLVVEAPPEDVFRAFTSLGGENGWLVWKWAWALRGWMDRIAGGPGLRRGRRHPTELVAGEAVDFWRVEAVEPPRLLRLRAEMKLPGGAWLQYEALPERGGTRLVQTALFRPVGLAGTLYWYGLYPAHKLLFNDLVRAVAKRAA